MIAAAPRLRLIQKIGVGVNTIDLEAARARGIAVCNLPGTNARAVAELTLALMLAVLRRLPRFDAAMRRGAWADPALQDGIGELGGCTVGLVGYGAIPRLLAPVLIALGCRLIYTALATGRRAGRMADAGCAAGRGGRGQPASAADAETTESLIDAAALARMKPGAVLINTARGGLVDQAALTEALASGRLAGAGLDVFVHEPHDATDALFAPAQRRADAAHRLADHRHVRPQLRAGRGELPPPRRRRGFAAPRGLRGRGSSRRPDAEEADHNG